MPESVHSDDNDYDRPANFVESIEIDGQDIDPFFGGILTSASSETSKKLRPGTIPIKVCLLSEGLRICEQMPAQFEVEDLENPCVMHIVKLYPFNLVTDIATEIDKGLEVPLENQRLFLNGVALSMKDTLGDANITENSIIDLQNLCDASDPLCEPIEFYGHTSTASDCFDLVEACRAGIKYDFAPTLSEFGTGATYFMHNEVGERIACFKPLCEEQNAPNNPRGNVSALGTISMQRAILSGEQVLRERAAYLLDNTGFHDVPRTTPVQVRRDEDLRHFNYNNNSGVREPKIGSLQEYVQCEHDLMDNNAGMFGAREVHKIGILDIRLLNCDRNAENILAVRDPETRCCTLIPIDHGLCLPEKLEIGWCDWVWTQWPQSKQGFDPHTLEFIDFIDIEADLARLSAELPLSPQALANARVSATVLKVGAKHGLTLFEIASLILRQNLQQPSELELICAQAEKVAKENVEKERLSHHRGNKEEKSTHLDRTKHSPSSQIFIEGVQMADPNSAHMVRAQSCLNFTAHEDDLDLTDSYLVQSTTPPDDDFYLSKTNDSFSSSSPHALQSLENFDNRITHDDHKMYWIEKQVELRIMKIRQTKKSKASVDIYDYDTPVGTFKGLDMLNHDRSKKKEKTQDMGELFGRIQSEPVKGLDMDEEDAHFVHDDFEYDSDFFVTIS